MYVGNSLARRTQLAVVLVFRRKQPWWPWRSHHGGSAGGVVVYVLTRQNPRGNTHGQVDEGIP